MTSKIIPPSPKRENTTIEQLGHIRHDPYAWMKDENWQKVLRDPTILKDEIRIHLEAENQYCKEMLQETENLQEKLFEEMKGRLCENDESVPFPDGDFLYGRRFEEGKQYPIIFRKHKDSDKEDILLDANKRANNKNFYNLGQFQHTHDHKIIAFSEDTQGSEVFNIYIQNIASKKFQKKIITESTGSFTFSPDGQWLFWIWRDDNGRPSRIYRRSTAIDNDENIEDILIYEETNPGFFLNISTTRSRKWILIERGDHDTNEILTIAASDPTQSPQTIAPAKEGEHYSLTHWNDKFIICTNHIMNNQEKAIDFELMKMDDHLLGRENWEIFLPHKKGHYILDVTASQDYLIWTERYNGNEEIHILSKDIIKNNDSDLRKASQIIKMDDPAYDLLLIGVLEYKKPILRYIYQSPSTPPHWYDYNMDNHERILKKVKEIPSGHTPSDYLVKRVSAQANDGETVPITILMKKDTPQNGTAPLLLYGYGAYGISTEAGFSTGIFNLVNRGWIYAIAHIRGGTEKGWGWFLDGKAKHKKNSFTDFISCARYLIDEKYTQRQRIIAHGGSAGGLLMGAVANMAPELFAGIAAQVPFVDMLNTMSDVSLPLTPPEWPEWGNPLRNEKDYELIASYSPYDNIKSVQYPAILATGGLSDPRVTYWEPAKWIARLRDSAKDGPFLCHINMDAGHGGSQGRYQRLKEAALIQAFALWSIKRKINAPT